MQQGETTNADLNKQEQEPCRSEKEAVEEDLDQLPKDVLIKKISELKALCDKNYDLYLRAEAEIDNIKKRFKRERDDLGKFANESILKELLPVMDNLQNAVLYLEGKKGDSSLVEGVSLTLKMLAEVLKKWGVREINAQGQEFDPNLHQAVMNEEVQDLKPGLVVKELQKGYILNERLLRPSMVVVSKTPAQT